MVPPQCYRSLYKSVTNTVVSLLGAQGVPEDMLLRAGKLGVCKINIDTDLRLAMTASIREHFSTNPGDFDPRQYLKPAREAIKNMVRHKIKNVLNCSNRI